MIREAAFSNFKPLHSRNNVTAANIIGHLRGKTKKKTAVIHLTGQKKLSRGNRIQLLVSEMHFSDSSDVAQGSSRRLPALIPLFSPVHHSHLTT